jgi:hypothetical protein
MTRDPRALPDDHALRTAGSRDRSDRPRTRPGPTHRAPLRPPATWCPHCLPRRPPRAAAARRAYGGAQPNRQSAHAHTKPWGNDGKGRRAHSSQPDPVTPSVNPVHANNMNEIWLDSTADTAGDLNSPMGIPGRPQRRLGHHPRHADRTEQERRVLQATAPMHHGRLPEHDELRPLGSPGCGAAPRCGVMRGHYQLDLCANGPFRGAAAHGTVGTVASGSGTGGSSTAARVCGPAVTTHQERRGKMRGHAASISDGHYSSGPPALRTTTDSTRSARSPAEQSGHRGT